MTKYVRRKSQSDVAPVRPETKPINYKHGVMPPVRKRTDADLHDAAVWLAEWTLLNLPRDQRQEAWTELAGALGLPWVTVEEALRS
jgi:hypothetical protein